MTNQLECRGLVAGYGGTPVVRDLALSVRGGELLAILGPNGAGKTTTLLTLAGLIPRLGGEISTGGAPSSSGRGLLGRRARPGSGVVLVPDDRALFTQLTTRQNLRLAAQKGGRTIDDVLALLPELSARMDVAAGMLSGGEQQMLAIGRALMQEPRVLLVDELSMGLAPLITERLLGVVRRVADETGAAVVLVEQHVRLALASADRAVVLVHGEIAVEDSAAALLAAPERIQAAYLGGAA